MEKKKNHLYAVSGQRRFVYTKTTNVIVSARMDGTKSIYKNS